MGYAIPRSLTLIDLSVVLSIVNCAALVWHGAVFRREATKTLAASPLAPGLEGVK
jgi:hypothetical protein